MTSTETEFISIVSPSEGGSDTTVTRGGKSLPDALPILGLADVVIFPGMVSPLLVESASSIRLIDDVVAGDRFLGLVLQRRPDVEDPKPADLWEHGCAVRVLKMLKFPDNTVRVLVEGLRRLHVLEYLSDDPYLRATVSYLREVAEESVELTALARSAQRTFQEIINLSPAMSDEVKVAVLNTEQPAKLADLIAANLNMGLQERQRLLEAVDVKERFNHLLPLLNHELEVLMLGSKIQKEVASSMSRSQRDFFLREQLRAIQRELGESDPLAADLNSLRDQIQALELPEETAKVAFKELDRLHHIPPSTPEHTVIRNYLDWILGLPWNKFTEDKLDLEAAAHLLDQHHYGLAKVKDRLIEFLAVIQLRRHLKGPILCLVGPPGVGKTSLGRSVAETLGRKFARISLGGMRDEAEIRGHRRTYVGALPGRILQCLRRAESRNPVMLLDEIDKVGSDFRGDPASALLEVLDPEQNSTFTDHYLDLPFDLSRVLFITTANWLDPIHAALRDRLEVIEIPSYTASEKLQIARRHLVPRQLEEHGLGPAKVRFPDALLRRLIHDYTREAGVRQLERGIASLARKAARRLLGDGKPTPLMLKAADLPDYLGPARYTSETAGAITEAGVAIGMAWNPVGGDILFIEATRMPGQGKLLLTGSLGEVMKESAQTAVSLLRSQARALGLDLTDFERHDLHIHVPAGATPKDGPSAGLTIAVALASLFSQRRVRGDTAMTGEISLRGRILPVGGIKEKVLAANRAGIRQVLLPADNQKDWTEVPAEVRQRMKVHFVRHLPEVLELALRDKGRSKNPSQTINRTPSLSPRKRVVRRTG